jgi:hypothetical protein
MGTEGDVWASIHECTDGDVKGLIDLISKQQNPIDQSELSCADKISEARQDGHTRDAHHGVLAKMVSLLGGRSGYSTRSASDSGQVEAWEGDCLSTSAVQEITSVPDHHL